MLLFLFSDVFFSVFAFVLFSFEEAVARGGEETTQQVTSVWPTVSVKVQHEHSGMSTASNMRIWSDVFVI